MAEENVSQEFSANDIDEREIYFIEIWSKMNDELINKKHKKVSKILNYIERLLILEFTITGCVSICTFPSLVGIS